MDNESKLRLATPVAQPTGSSEKSYVEDPYSLNEYARMYYVMTPPGCG